jgi:hypothetical protein
MPTVIKRSSGGRVGEKDSHGNCFHDLANYHRTFLRATFSLAPPVLNQSRCFLPHRLWAGNVVFKVYHLSGRISQAGNPWIRSTIRHVEQKWKP